MGTAGSPDSSLAVPAHLQGDSQLYPVGDEPSDLASDKAPWLLSRLPCSPPSPQTRAPGGVEPWVGTCRQERDAGGIASPTDASMGGQVSAEPMSEAAPPCQQSWNEVPGSSGWEANPELNVALPGVPLDTETPVFSPHILPAVPSMAQLVQLHSPLVLCPMPGWVMLQLRRGQCRSHSRQSAGTLC